jgi:uncharacterized phage-like protein YoqJ
MVASSLFGKTKDKAIEKVQKLLQITKDNGSSEAEINMALISIRKIIMRHSLSADEYEVKEDNGYTRSYLTKTMSYETRDWKHSFINQLCILYSCYGYSSGDHCFVINGKKSDVILVVETADYLLPVVSHLALTGYQEYADKIRNKVEAICGIRFTIKQCREYKYIKTTKAQYVKSYIHGFTIGMVARLTPQKDEETTDDDVEKYTLMTLDKIEQIKFKVMETVPIINLEYVKPKLVDEFWQKGYEDGKKDMNKEIEQGKVRTMKDIFGNDVPKVAHFTGHRPEKLSGYKISENGRMIGMLTDSILNHVENKGVTAFITGMALGVDMWSALIVLDLKKTVCPNIKLICAIPCKNQTNKWVKERKEEWEKIVSEADEVIYVSDKDYTDTCMQKRNEYMVDESDYTIAVWDGSNGGTKNCIDYAKKKGMEITYINPK